MTTEEIELLERVLFRFGTADTDVALEAAVLKFLAPVLLKITSPAETVRCKVMEILTHLNKRLKSRPQVQLPVEALLDQYQATDSQFLHNFSIIYIAMGFPRLAVDRQTELATKLMNCLEAKPESHQDKMLMLVLPLLGSIAIPEDPAKRYSLLGLEDKPSTKRQLIALLQDVLLLPYGVTVEAEVPAGLSPYAFKRVIANGWSAEQLEQLKKGLCRFICAGVFRDRDALALLVLASADTRFSVATPAIAELNKLNSSLDWSDAALSAPLYTLFLGNKSKQPERATSACSARVRQKLLGYLMRGRGRGISTVRGIQVIFEALFGAGGSNQKCKVLALQFAENLVRDGEREVLDSVARVILGGVAKLLGPESPEPADVQTAAYNVMAQLARTCPAIVNRDLQLVGAYFEHLCVAPTELQTALREALVALATAFDWRSQSASAAEESGTATTTTTTTYRPNANQQLLLAMLAGHVESKSAIVQNVASVFLITCYPDHYVPARYLLLLLLAGERTSLSEMVISYLYGVSKKDHINYAYITSVSAAVGADGKPNDGQTESTDADAVNQLSTEQRRIVLPDFVAMCTYVAEQTAKRDAGSAAAKHSYGRVVLPYTYEAYTEMLEYLRLCLWFSAGARTAPGDAAAVQRLADYVTGGAGVDVAEQKYLPLVKRILYAKRGRAELSGLYDLLDVAPSRFAPLCVDLLDGFDGGLKDVTDGTRTLVAQVQGILLAYGDANDGNAFDGRIKEMLVSLAQRSLEHRHGSVLTIAHAFRRKIERVRAAGMDVVTAIEGWETLRQKTELLIKLLAEQQPLLVSAGIKGLSLIGSAAPLVLPPGNDELTPPTAVDANKMDVDVPAGPTKHSVAETVLRLLKSAHTKAKTREEAAVCLGHLAIGDGAFYVKSNLKRFIGLVKLSKDTAMNIAIAQGIVHTVLGHEDHQLASAHKSADTVNPHCTDAMLTEFITSVISFVADPNPASRNATAIWLLALVKNLGARPAIYQRKQLLQFAFTELLSDDSDFVQDVASRGLGLVYALSDPTAQSDLANSLLDQLIGGKRQVNQVNADTQLFEEGVLGKTPMGGNITTYKELCSLASDLNQPEMIYQFMQLANHNAAWNSKLGAAFGLQSISSTAKAQMQPHLGRIVPRLFRYKYDPTPKIQNSMCSIWDSVVSDPKETVERFYWEIFAELCTNLTQVEWRVRIACCLAVRDLIKRPTGLRLRCDDRARSALKATAAGMEVDDAAEVAVGEVPEPELLELWRQLFRVMDDVHEGTRLAAEGTAKALSKICVVAAGSSAITPTITATSTSSTTDATPAAAAAAPVGNKSAHAIAASILPFVLESGVTHMVPEIRALSMRTLSELIDSSGAVLTPHLPRLVPCLLRATGELEIPKLSYLSTRLGAHSEAQEAVDSLRAEAAKSHHSMETLSKCVRHIDYAALERMTPEVCDLMRTTVNLGTKIACAHFVCLIALRFGAECQPLAGKLLGAALHGLRDRNAVVRKYNASAIGHLVGVAKEQSVVRLFGKLSELYFESQSNRGVPQTLQSINKRQQDVLKDYAAHVLPLIFFARHETVTDENRDAVELWQELWTEVSPGDAGIRLNLDAIVPQLEHSLAAASWPIKAQAAAAIATLAQRLRAQLPQEDRLRLMRTLLDGLAGRTFVGKERLLQALAQLSRDLAAEPTEAAEMRQQLIDAVMRECRKEEPLYRTHALRAIGDILEQLKVDRFEEVYNMIWYLMDKKDLAAVTGEVDDDAAAGKAVSSDERNRRALVVVQLKEVVCETLGKAWPAHATETQQKYQLQFVERCVQCLQNNTRPVQLSLLVALGKFLERLQCLDVVPPAVAMDDAMSPAQQQNAEKKARVDRPDEQLERICRDVLSAVVYVAGISHTGLKKEALSIVLILAKKLIDNRYDTELALLRKTFVDVNAMLLKDTAPEIKCRLKDIDDKLKAAATI